MPDAGAAMAEEQPPEGVAYCRKGEQLGSIPTKAGS
jgi:hypothetical protein